MTEPEGIIAELERGIAHIKTALDETEPGDIFWSRYWSGYLTGYENLLKMIRPNTRTAEERNDG